MMIRKMTPGDIAGVISLTDQEHWRYGHGDIERLMRIDPHGCMVLGEEPLGCVFAPALGDKGVIGGLIVDKEHRGMGYGRMLLEAALEHLEQRTTSMELFSYENTTNFYRKMGFQRGEGVLRMVGQVARLQQPPNAANMTLDDKEWLEAFDSTVFGANRTTLLMDIIETGFAVKGSGYGMAKGSPKDCFDAGPIVCEDSSMWRALMNRLPNGCIEVSIPETRGDAIEEAKRSGLQQSFRNIRMTRGGHGPLHNNIWAIGGLEKG